MKKLIILVVVVLLCIAGWAGATYFNSTRIEEQYQSLTEKYSRMGTMTLASMNYQRGFLSSTAETLVEVRIPKIPVEEGKAPGVETVQLVFEHTIYNGPLMFGAGRVVPALAFIDTRLVIPSEGSGELKKLLSEIPELKDSFAHTTIGFDGKAKVNMEVPPFDKQDEDKSVTWGGLTVKTDYAPIPGTLVGTVFFGSVDARFEDGSMNWQGAKYDFDLVQVLPMLFVGPSQAVIGDMKIEVISKDDGEKNFVTMNELKMISTSNYDGRLVHSSNTMLCDGVTIDGETYGPLEFDLELKNLNGQALSDFQQKSMSAYNEVDQFNQDEILAQLMPLYADLAVQLLTDSPELNIKKLYVNTPMGEAHGTLRLKYDNPQNGTPIDLASLFLYLQYFDASTDLIVDQLLVKNFMKSYTRQQIQAASANGRQPEMSELEIDALINQQIEAQLGMFEARGFIARENKTIKTEITFSGGQLSVNGKLMPIGL
jgi:uncharacterized protein YdgA (DUF945 family)